MKREEACVLRIAYSVWSECVFRLVRWKQTILGEGVTGDGGDVVEVVVLADQMEAVGFLHGGQVEGVAGEQSILLDVATYGNQIGWPQIDDCQISILQDSFQQTIH